MRLVVGYGEIGCEDIVSENWLLRRPGAEKMQQNSFEDIRPLSTPWKNLYDQAITTDRIEDTTEWMLERDMVFVFCPWICSAGSLCSQFLNDGHQTDLVTAYVLFSVRAIYRLKFAEDWMRKGTTTEGREWKRDYLDWLFILQEKEATEEAKRFAGQMGKKKLQSV